MFVVECFSTFWKAFIYFFIYLHFREREKEGNKIVAVLLVSQLGLSSERGTYRGRKLKTIEMSEQIRRLCLLRAVTV